MRVLERTAPSFPCALATITVDLALFQSFGVQTGETLEMSLEVRMPSLM